jgi:putative acetyltransferase
MDIHVRHVESGDAQALRDLYSHAECVAGTLQIPFPSISGWQQRIESPPEGSVALVAEIDRQVVGHAGLLANRRTPRRAHAGELGIAVHPDWQRQGVGTSLIAALVDLADNWLNLSRLELTVFVDNAAARELYGNFGFEVEGTHRGYAFRDGRLVDVLSMARIRQRD